MTEADHWVTPAEVFGPLNERFRFTIDVAAAVRNAKCERFYTASENGLMQSWAGERVWCNPPYSHPNLGRWLDKAWREASATEAIVMLVPADRTGQPWWQQHVEPFRDRPPAALRCEFLPGRIRYLAPSLTRNGPSRRPLFSSCLLIWGETQPTQEGTHHD